MSFSRSHPIHSLTPPALLFSQYKEQTINVGTTSSNIALNILAATAFTVVSVLAQQNLFAHGEDSELGLSRFIAISLLVIYISFLYFQLRSHQHLFGDLTDLPDALSAAAPDAPSNPLTGTTPEPSETTAMLPHPQADVRIPVPHSSSLHETKYLGIAGACVWLVLITLCMCVLGRFPVGIFSFVLMFPVVSDLTRITAPCLLLSSIVSEFLVQNIQGAAVQWGLPDIFISTILLPIVANAAEHATAMTVAYRGKITLSVSVAMGSATQIAMFVLPLCIIIAWACGYPLSADLRSFEMITWFVFAFFLLFCSLSNFSSPLAFYPVLPIASLETLFFHSRSTPGTLPS